MKADAEFWTPEHTEASQCSHAQFSNCVLLLIHKEKQTEHGKERMSFYSHWLLSIRMILLLWELLESYTECSPWRHHRSLLFHLMKKQLHRSLRMLKSAFTISPNMNFTLYRLQLKPACGPISPIISSCI